MKFLLIAFLVGSMAHAEEPLPSYLANEVDKALGSTSFFVQSHKLVERMEEDRNFKDSVVEKQQREIPYGLRKPLEIATSSSAAVVGATFFSSLSAVGGPNPSFRSLEKFGILDEDLLLGSMYTFFIAGGSMVAGVMTLEKNVQKKVLNNEKVDQYSAVIGNTFAQILKLNKAREGAIRFAIRETIHEKAKAKDDSPLDVLAVVMDAKYAGKPVLTEAERETMADIAKHLKTVGVKEALKSELSEKQKITTLQHNMVLMDVAREQARFTEDDKRKLDGILGDGRRVMKGVTDFRAIEKRDAEVPAETKGATAE